MQQTRNCILFLLQEIPFCVQFVFIFSCLVSFIRFVLLEGPSEERAELVHEGLVPGFSMYKWASPFAQVLLDGLINIECLPFQNCTQFKNSILLFHQLVIRHLISIEI